MLLQQLLIADNRINEAVRKYLAWDSILAEKVTPLNLDPQQVKQAESQRDAADGVVKIRLPETYQWLLVPRQGNPSAAVEWQALRLYRAGTAGSASEQETARRRVTDRFLCPFAAAHGA
ncbi:MAG: hypothetical protein HGB26_02300 [Desulfobulbaceae bacterium]|nr:hypothetical protein [Desulfobulbaceae bacterium]